MAKTIYSPEQQVLAVLLRELRVAAGLRQVDVAEKLGRPQSLVAKIEAGQRRVDIVELQIIAVALGSDLSTVVSEFVRRTGPATGN